MQQIGKSNVSVEQEKVNNYYETPASKRQTMGVKNNFVDSQNQQMKVRKNLQTARISPFHQRQQFTGPANSARREDNKLDVLMEELTFSNNPSEVASALESSKVLNIRIR